MITILFNTPPINDKTSQLLITGKIVSHDTRTMTSMKNITKGYSEVIRRIDNPRNVFHDDITVFMLILNNEIPDNDMPGLVGWRCILIDDF